MRTAICDPDADSHKCDVKLKGSMTSEIILENLSYFTFLEFALVTIDEYAMEQCHLQKTANFQSPSPYSRSSL